MLKKVVKYVDYNGENQSDVLYFNLNEVEVVRFAAEFPDGDIEKYIENLTENSNIKEIMFLFEKALQHAYGERSEDGKHFLKSQERSDLFAQSAAYSALFIELATDTDKATEFINALLSRTAPEQKPQG